jgi:hypothetical protein
MVEQIVGSFEATKKAGDNFTPVLQEYLTGVPDSESTRPAFDATQALKDLNSGEMLRILADVDAGRITPEEFQAVLQKYESLHWLRRFYLSFMGR